ncbi:DEAD/DEAH box helicase family protein [Holzapfeliella floricola]|uniref:DEAD/DEAH box helicase family protein n=1 Tax=Holzapfeliella floricola TaxID=679249 RepID=UPI000A638AED|nr:DEAD/DEAH box helicase family protein [Holzapfeliella floricola]
MLGELMDSIIENNPNNYEYSFVWLTPGNGELEEQSYKSISEKARLVKTQMIQDSLMKGFCSNTVTFINWEKVTKKGNIAVRDGEVKNIYQQIQTAHQKGLHFVVIVDEEHRNRNKKTQDLIDYFKADKIIRTSATPQSRGEYYELVQIDEEDVINQGMISQSVILNMGVNDGDNISDPVSYFLDLADEKRREIKQSYDDLGKNINPLVLIQLPDEKKGVKNKEYTNARSDLIQNIENYLREIGQQESEIARWLSGDHFNTENVEKNNSRINYLLMKQAVSTGWDAPRAKILVTLRLNMDVEFTLQTIGRIRRMPEQKHYGNKLLDNSYVFSNDTSYINNVLKDEQGSRIAQYQLNPHVPNFGLFSVKSNELAKMTVEETTRSYWKLLTQKYNLSRDRRDYNH